MSFFSVQTQEILKRLRSENEAKSVRRNLGLCQVRLVLMRLPRRRAMVSSRPNSTGPVATKASSSKPSRACATGLPRQTARFAGVVVASSASRRMARASPPMERPCRAARRYRRSFKPESRPRTVSEAARDLSGAVGMDAVYALLSTRATTSMGCCAGSCPGFWRN